MQKTSRGEYAETGNGSPPRPCQPDWDKVFPISWVLNYPISGL